MIALEETTTAEGVPTDIAFDDELGSHIMALTRTNWAKYALDQARQARKDAPPHEELYLTFPTPTEAAQIRLEVQERRSRLQ